MLKHCSSLSLSTNSLENTAAVSPSKSCSIKKTSYSTPEHKSEQHKIVKVWIDGSNSGSYRTIRIHEDTTCRDVINRLVSRMRVRCADPKLHQLHMQVSLMESVKVISLDDNSRLLEILRCNPWPGSYKLILVKEERIMVRVWDSSKQELMFKSILVTRDANVSTILDILHQYHPHIERQTMSLYESSEPLRFSRKLNNEEIIVKIMESWCQESLFRFVMQINDKNSQHNDMKMFLQSLLDDSRSIEFEDNILCDTTLDDSCSSSDLSDISSINSDSFLYVPFHLIHETVSE